MFGSVLSRRPASMIAVVCIMFAVGSASIVSAKEPLSYKISATYQVTLNSFNVGTVRYLSNVERGHYVAESKIELSALFGAVSWKGVARSSGTVGKRQPKPANYRFDFDGVAGSGAVDMGFSKASVSTLVAHPAPLRAADMVPVKGEHLEGVLDPLSAILALTHNQSSSPCGRKVAVFDGQQRFDLELYTRRRAAAGESADLVCRVKYRPISGYRANAETKAMARNTGIEIAFRPESDAGLMVPYSVKIPMTAGPIRLQVLEVDIQTPDNRKIALANGHGGW